jgi:hypothetical protein
MAKSERFGTQSGIERKAAAADQGRAPGVGKQTLVEQAYGREVQLRADAAVRRDESTVHAAAERGVATPPTALPHAASIQHLFGRHDISSIRAHTGSEAAVTARAMGAQAYATGNHVVLGDGADLFTVAHEAAHVVQQRGGVQLKAGVGEAGDSHEQHADEVASLVVQGKSAEAALDRHAGDGAPAGSATVQRPVIQLMRLVAHHEDHDEVEFRQNEPQPDGNGHYKDDGYHYEEVSRTPSTILYERREEVAQDKDKNKGKGDESDDESEDDSSGGEAEREPNILDDVPDGPKLDPEEFQHYIEEAKDEIRKAAAQADQHAG